MSLVYHPYHLVDPSPWPFVGASGAFLFTSGAVVYFHYSDYRLALTGLIIIIITSVVWWRDVIREGTHQGHHTKIVVRGLKLGMFLFIVSEVCLFFAFFWAFFHSSLAPSVELGGLWPPNGIEALDPFAIPLLNTTILLSSGATVTWAHHAIIGGGRTNAILGLFLTIVLGIIFTGLQAFEYKETSFAISDSVYGATFFMLTGTHGLHVLVGTTFLTVCFFRLLSNQFTTGRHVGLEAAIWYWHFVDVVWLFLYVFVYWWGS
uniref:Cytochrome c oxidase subunit 3 n=1 Tax=Polyplacotoma mediterranea TaxID=2283839 RepID=A0A481YKV5_9METZ|nr:cytochrome c oxidase subunit III [Polyplacotoma mediterranea]QBK82179.1 cytochrome c oxidase subunit III [Polyplacotoma mediterranea]